MNSITKKIGGGSVALASALLLLFFLWFKPYEPEMAVWTSADIIQKNSSENTAQDSEQSGKGSSITSNSPFQNNASEVTFNELTSASTESGQKILLAQAFTQAENALDAQEIAWEISNFEPALANRLIMNISDFCSLGELEFYPEGLQTKNQAFCEEFQTTNDLVESFSLDSALEMVDSDPFLQIEVNLEHSLENSRGKPKTEVFTQLVINSIFPEEIEILMGINYRHQEKTGVTLWKLGSEIRTDRYPMGNLLEAQITALTLFRCSRFGGCGKNHYYTAHYCATIMGGACKSEDTLEQMLYSITRPVDFALAQDILAELYTHKGSFMTN